MTNNRKPIGGYFELELNRGREFPHSEGILTNSGRHALEYILRGLPKKPNMVWLPSYTCEVVLQPLNNLGIQHQFYAINSNLHIEEYPVLNNNDYIIVNNYFGILDEYMREVSDKYLDKLIIDNSQAWYARELSGIKQFYSPRKYFGVPDGGIALVTKFTDNNLEQDISFDRCSHLLKRIDLGSVAGYMDFRVNSAALAKEPLKRMSKLTEKVLRSIDFEGAKAKRRENFNILHSALRATNKYKIPDLSTFSCPMAYPYVSDNEPLRQRLIDNNIFVATYWPNVFEWCRTDSNEYYLAKHLLPLPVDQRYDAEDMDYIIKIIKG